MSTPEARCPSTKELSDFILGKLPDDSCDQLVHHVEQCPPCLATLTGLEHESDTLLNDVRAQASAPPVTDMPECQQIVAQIQELTPDSAQSLNGDEVANDSSVATFNTQLSAEITEQDHQSPVAASGSEFGEYTVLERIGAGGMGEVYKAKHRRMNRVVAIKVLPPAAMRSADAVKRFQREVEAAARLSHPNIVAAYDAGEQHGVHYLVMEYVPGCDLSRRLRERGPLPADEAVSYILQAARGLAYAHGKGVVHRDIKPANLLLSDEGTLKVLDMGLARFDDAAGAVISAAEEGLTQSGQVMGTVDYMAPEQAFDTRHVDGRADIYSLGCTLYRLLTGEAMYAGETLVQKLIAHREQPIPSLRAARANIPAELDRILSRMVGKLPQDRYASMNDLVHDLEQLDLGSGQLAMPAVALPSHPAGISRRKKWLALATVAGICLLAGVVVIIRDNQGNETARITVPTGSTVSVEPLENRPPSVPPGETVASALPPAVADKVPSRSPWDALDPAAIPPEERFDWQPKELVAVLGSQRQRLPAAGYRISFMADGKTVLTSNESKSEHPLWDVATRRVIQTLPHAHKGVLSPDGEWVLHGNAIHAVHEPDAPPVAVLNNFLADQGLQTFSPDRRRIFARLRKGRAIGMWNLDPPQLEPVITWENFDGYSLSPDGTVLALVAFATGNVQLLDVTAWPPKSLGELTVPGGIHAAQRFTSLLLSSRRLVTYSRAGLLQLWDLADPLFRELNQCQDPDLSPGDRVGNTWLDSPMPGERFLVCTESKIMVWTSENAELRLQKRWVRTTSFVNDNLNSAAASPDGKFIVTAHLNGAVRFLDAEADPVVEIEPLQPQPATSSGNKFVSINDDLLLSDNEHSRVSIFRLGKAQPESVPYTGVLDRGSMSRFALARDSDRAIIGHAHESGAHLIQINATGPSSEGVLPGGNGTAMFSADGRRLARWTHLEGGKLSVWGFDPPRKLFERPAPEGSDGMTHVQLSADGKTLVIGNPTGTALEIGDVTDEGLQRVRILPLSPACRVRLSQDGRTLLTQIRSKPPTLWDVTVDPPTKLPLELPTDLGEWITADQPADAPNLWALAGTSGVFGIWDTERGFWKYHARVPRAITAIACTRDGRHLTTIHRDGMIYIYRIDDLPSDGLKK